MGDVLRHRALVSVTIRVVTSLRLAQVVVACNDRVTILVALMALAAVHLKVGHGAVQVARVEALVRRIITGLIYVSSMPASVPLSCC